MLPRSRAGLGVPQLGSGELLGCVASLWLAQHPLGQLAQGADGEVGLGARSGFSL